MVPCIPPPSVFRVGRQAVVWDLADWQFADSSGRFDDPTRTYRVRYVAHTPHGALIEKLQSYRPDIELLHELYTSMDGDDHAPLPLLPFVFNDYKLGAAEIKIAMDQGLADLVTGRGYAQAHSEIWLAAKRANIALTDYDASTLLSASTRSFTQALSAIAYEQGFAGIAYRSRFDPSEICYAFFEGRHDVAVKTISQIPSAFLEKACEVHNLIAPDFSDATIIKTIVRIVNG